MNKKQKKLIAIICIVVVIIGAVFTYQYIMRQREAAREIAMEQQQIMIAYQRVNTLQFAYWRFFVPDPEDIAIYMPFREIDPELNRFDVDVYLYIFLKFYEQETGTALVYEKLIDYFSEEFEPDGSLRLYNNGNHPEIQALVEWMWGERAGNFARIISEWSSFYDDVWRIYRAYMIEHADSFEHIGCDIWHLRPLSPKMLDVLVRAYADPDYVLDLTSIQQAGY